MTKNLSNRTLAILWMTSSAFFGSVMVACVRYIGQEVDSAFQIVFLRNLLAILFFLPWVFNQGSNAFKTTRMKMYWLRAVIGLLAMYLWFYALTVIELPIAVSLSFVAPLVTALLAVVFFKEKFGPHRWSALIVGFLGTLIILDPTTGTYDIKQLIALGSAVMWAVTGIVIKHLCLTDSPIKVSFFMVIMMTPLAFPLAYFTWDEVPMHMWTWLLVLGLTSNLFQISLAKAVAIAPFHAILPIDFTRLIFSSIIAYIVFAEMLTLQVFIGSVVIMAAAVYSAYRDHLHNKKPATPQVSE